MNHNTIAIVNNAIKAGAKKVFIVGYADNDYTVYTERYTLRDAVQIKQQMILEGHRPFIDVYAR